MGPVLTQVEELPENKVRLSVEVPREDMKHAVEHATSDLAASLRIPGFRKGKVPRPVLLARVGRERVMAEAVESHIGAWFRSAAASSRVLPVSQPEYAYELPTSEEEAFRFSATVAVQPRPEPIDWTQLEVPHFEAEVPDDMIEDELAQLQYSVAPLEAVDGRPVKRDDVVVIDLVGPTGEARRDYVVEVGDPRFIDEVSEALVGMAVGETATAEYQEEEGGGQLEVTVKEIHERVLPPLDDEFARAASEFDTLQALRADIASTLEEQIRAELDTQFRADAVDALVDASQVHASGPLVESRARELLAGLERSLERRGVSLDTYLAVSNEEPATLVERLRAQAARAVARELVLEAVADKLDLEVSDEEVRALIREQAEAAGEKEPEEAVQRIFDGPVREALRNDLRLRAALDRVVAEVKRIPADLARARDKLWTPEKEKAPGDTKLWTPATTKEPA